MPRSASWRSRSAVRSRSATSTCSVISSVRCSGGKPASATALAMVSAKSPAATSAAVTLSESRSGTGQFPAVVERRTSDVARQRFDQPRPLGDLEQLVAADPAALRTLPASQRLGADEAAVGRRRTAAGTVSRSRPARARRATRRRSAVRPGCGARSGCGGRRRFDDSIAAPWPIGTAASSLAGGALQIGTAALGSGMTKAHAGNSFRRLALLASPAERAQEAAAALGGAPIGCRSRKPKRWSCSAATGSCSRRCTG